MSVELTTPDLTFEPQILAGAGAATANLGPVWILEEVAGHLRAQGRKTGTPRIRLYRLIGDVLTAVSEQELSEEVSRIDTAMSLLEAAKARSGVVVCSFRTVATVQMVERLEANGPNTLHYVVEIDPARRLAFARARDGVRTASAKERVEAASWQQINLSKPAGGSECYAANLGKAALGGVQELTCFALSIGGIKGYQRGVLVGLTSLSLDDGLKNLAQLLAWTRWVRLAARKAKRERTAIGAVVARSPDATDSNPALNLVVRANRKIAAGHDAKAANQRSQLLDQPVQFRRRLTENKSTLNVVELFAGAGGMGLGFLSARSTDGRGYRIAGSAEIHPIYTQTLRRNHAYMQKAGLTPGNTTPAEYAPMDLCSDKVRTHLGAMVREHGDVDVLIGGPPCQGFSSANRNSWSSSNPNNRLVDAFLDCVLQMAPKVLLMENVQGILWTPREGADSDLSVAAHVLERLGSMGYLVFPKLLDAVWYGAPQNRNRFFLLGIHKDVGYSVEDFGKWGPFPKPTHGPGTNRAFVTVRDAIADLPKLGNGDALVERAYDEDAGRLQQNAFLRAMRAGAPKGIIWDHVTSRHAEYVIERYRGIGQGQNWQAVRDLMTNYADVERTHSNIYRRLAWSEPAITMGHYRKSMIIHPAQHRGLSLREAARLQCFPDWFRFAGTATGGEGGLMHKQQQLANAVCPNVTKAVAEFILQL
ncbi:DNA cytosine methyltransferase [Burkholderia gladioli]|uniref:DNA cytosine methyltransferase n=2 Tax=Burkholderia gladioli TaxID=28095 RepID=UPI00136490B3|nr:DNA cytosine methyltransferase [Burkholderia gladioli]KAF1062882.1 Modification methylase BspRI [Burkholderia gladioli]WAG19150.1 DNA cytosine methyltransferase [Burkholderia gladioli]